jgi:hypothetical protein
MRGLARLARQRFGRGFPELTPEQVGGIGCSCPGFQPGGEDQAHRCPRSPLCLGQRGGPRIPEPLRGCRGRTVSVTVF